MKILLSKNLAIVVAITVAFPLNSRAQKVVTLAQAIDSTLQNNLQLKQAQFTEAISEADVTQAKMSLIPSVNGNVVGYKLYGNNIDLATNQPVRSSVTLGQGNLYADVTLFQGFQKLNNIKENKYKLEANRSNVQKVKNDLTLAVLSTYLRVLTNRDLYNAARQQLSVAKGQLDREQKFYNVRQKTTADLSQAKSQVANAEANVTNAQNEMERAYLYLAQLMERKTGLDFTVTNPTKGEVFNISSNKGLSLKTNYKKAVQAFPDVQIAENRRLAYERAVYVAKGLLSPRLSLAGSLSTSYSGLSRSANFSQIIGNQTIGYIEGTNTRIYAPVYAYQNVSFGDQLDRNFNQAVGLVLTIPILNGYSANVNVRKAKLDYQNAVVAEQLTKDNLNKALAEAMWDIQATEKKYKAAQATFTLAEDAFKVTTERYTVGLVSSLDVGVSETNRNSAEFALIQAKYDLLFKSKLIDYYLGNPISF